MLILLWLSAVTCAPADEAVQKVAFVLNKSQCIIALIVASCTFIVLVIVLVD